MISFACLYTYVGISLVNKPFWRYSQRYTHYAYTKTYCSVNYAPNALLKLITSMPIMYTVFQKLWLNFRGVHLGAYDWPFIWNSERIFFRYAFAPKIDKIGSILPGAPHMHMYIRYIYGSGRSICNIHILTIIWNYFRGFDSCKMRDYNMIGYRVDLL